MGKIWRDDKDFVYIVANSSNTYMKVGYTKVNQTGLPFEQRNYLLHNRLRSLQACNPEKLRYVVTLNGFGRCFETHCHKLLSDLHVRGEWFHYSLDGMRRVLGEFDSWDTDFHGGDASMKDRTAGSLGWTSGVWFHESIEELAYYN